MRKARFTEHQIIAVLKSVEAGRTVKDVCREAGISEASYYNWKAKLGRRFRVFDVVDDFNREYPLKMRMDNGPELISLTLAQWAQEHGVMLEFIRPDKPMQNAFIERFNRTYRTEILDFYLFRTLNEAREIRALAD